MLFESVFSSRQICAIPVPNGTVELFLDVFQLGFDHDSLILIFESSSIGPIHGNECIGNCGQLDDIALLELCARDWRSHLSLDVLIHCAWSIYTSNFVDISVFDKFWDEDMCLIERDVVTVDRFLAVVVKVVVKSEFDL